MSDAPDPDEVLDYLAGQVYPASLSSLLDRARAVGAGDAVLGALAGIPDADYNGRTAVCRALLES